MAQCMYSSRVLVCLLDEHMLFSWRSAKYSRVLVKYFFILSMLSACSQCSLFYYYCYRIYFVPREFLEKGNLMLNLKVLLPTQLTILRTFMDDWYTCSQVLLHPHIAAVKRDLYRCEIWGDGMLGLIVAAFHHKIFDSTTTKVWARSMIEFTRCSFDHHLAESDGEFIVSILEIIDRGTARPRCII